MSRKRRPVHFVSFSLPGGASYAAAPERKPPVRKGRKQLFTQDDVSTEYEKSLEGYGEYPIENRQRFLSVLANRINTRRAIRELVLPELEAIVAAQKDIRKQLARIELALADQSPA